MAKTDSTEVRQPAMQPSYTGREREEAMESDSDKAARKLFRAQDAAKALSEHANEQKRFHANRERLRAERLSRVASAVASQYAAAAAAKKKPARKQLKAK